MQKSIFKQSRGILKIEAEILEDGVRYSESGLLHSSEVKIYFEYIADDLIRIFHVNRLYLLISLFFTLLLILRIVKFFTTDEVSLASLAISIFWFILASGGTWMQSPRYVGYMTNNQALLFFDHKGKQNPLPFLEQIKQAKHQYLDQRYRDSISRYESN